MKSAWRVRRSAVEQVNGVGKRCAGGMYVYMMGGRGWGVEELEAGEGCGGLVDVCEGVREK